MFLFCTTKLFICNCMKALNACMNGPVVGGFIQNESYLCFQFVCCSSSKYISDSTPALTAFVYFLFLPAKLQMLSYMHGTTSLPLSSIIPHLAYFSGWSRRSLFKYSRMLSSSVSFLLSRVAAGM